VCDGKYTDKKADCRLDTLHHPQAFYAGPAIRAAHILEGQKCCQIPGDIPDKDMVRLGDK
jgi:hypothetical protein